MKITDRDIEILRFINDFGFCEMPQVEKRFSVNRPRSYQIMERLVKAELVIHKRVFEYRHGVFYLTLRGASYTELSPVKNIPIGNYHHQLMTIEVYLKLMQQYPEAKWVTQRHLLKSTYDQVVGRRGHLADGMLILPNQKPVAIEVELGSKNMKQLKSILRSYMYNPSINGAWYFCLGTTTRQVIKAVGQWTIFEVQELQVFLGDDVLNSVTAF